jgi:hypothetical protein
MKPGRCSSPSASPIARKWAIEGRPIVDWTPKCGWTFTDWQTEKIGVMDDNYNLVRCATPRSVLPELGQWTRWTEPLLWGKQRFYREFIADPEMIGVMVEGRPGRPWSAWCIRPGRLRSSPSATREPVMIDEDESAVSVSESSALEYSALGHAWI